MIKKALSIFLVLAFSNFVIVPIRMRLIAYRKKGKPATLNHFLYFYAFLAFLLLFSCSPYSLQAPVDPPGPYTYGPPANVDFYLSSYEAGAEASHTLSFDIRQGDLQTYRVNISYSQSCTNFEFKGFLAVGPPNTQIGEYSIDFNFDNLPDFVIPLRSIDADNAYTDIDDDGIFNESIDFRIHHSGPSYWSKAHSFFTELYWGGDGNTGLTGAFSGRVTAVMFAGILTNPPFGGQYRVGAYFLSVDPDTGGIDNGLGEAPMSISDSRTITITGEPVPLTITGITSFNNMPAWKGISYIAILEACSGTLPYSWEIIGGSLPPGLELNTAGGISGKPTKTGTFTFTVKVTDAALSTDTKEFRITVSEPPDTGIHIGGGGGGGGGCFIATATYGSALHPHVKALREFRDNHLKKAAIGQTIVSLYERVSPPLAAVIARHEALRLVSRVALAPLVYGIAYPKAFGVSVLLFLAGVFAACHRAKRQTQID